MKILKVFFVIICLTALNGCWQQREGASSEIIPVKIAEEEFEIPKMYFYKFIPVNKQNRDVLLALVYPDFKAVNDFADNENLKRSHNDLIRFLVFDAHQNVPMETLIEKLKSTYGLEHYSGEYLGLEKWTAAPPEQKDNEMYVFKNNNKEIGYLKCHRDGAPQKYPQCNGNFVYSDTVWLEFSFSKTLLPQWPAIQEKSFLLLNKFQSNSK